MLLTVLAVLVLTIIAVLAAGWLGLQVKANSFPTMARGTAPRLIPIPTDLPAPVLRFAHAVFGDAMPDVRSALVLGRASLAPFGLPMPARFRFYYDAASLSYYHDIQVSWFTLPFLRIHERNLEGHTTLDLSILGKVNDAPKTNRAAIQGYWAEALAWVPSVVLSDTRIRWEDVDSTTARLHLQGLDDVESLTVRFDAVSGLISTVETQRYQSEASADRWRWFNRTLEWGTVNGLQAPIRSQTQWNDDRPWAIWEIEQIALNGDVAARMAQFGGDVT